MRLHLPSSGSLGCIIWPVAGIACSEGIPPNFYPACVNVGTAHLPLLPPPLCTTPHPVRPGSITPSLPSIWMHVASFNPWWSDSHTIQLSGRCGCFCFEVSSDPSCSCVRMWSKSTYAFILTRSPSNSILKGSIYIVFHTTLLLP